MASNEDETATFDGEPLDLAWTSDIADRDVKSTTEYATDLAEQQGDVSFDFLPSDVDAEDLTEIQRSILSTAAMQELGAVSDLAEMVGCSPQHCHRTLSTYAPEMHKEIKMSNAEAAKRRHEARELADEIEAEAEQTKAESDYTGMMSSPTQTSASAPDDDSELQARVDETIAKAETLEKVHPNSVAGRVARELRRSLEVDE